jgi:hypothetical protein
MIVTGCAIEFSHPTIVRGIEIQLVGLKVGRPGLRTNRYVSILMILNTYFCEKRAS